MLQEVWVRHIIKERVNWEKLLLGVIIIVFMNFVNNVLLSYEFGYCIGFYKLWILDNF